MTTYILTCFNESEHAGNFMLFQKPQPVPVPGGAASLAWFARPTQPGKSSIIQWTIDYGFVWSQSSTLQPGTVFQPAQFVPADPMGINLIQYGQDEHGVPHLSDPSANGQRGYLTIQQAVTVTPRRSAVGIAMSGVPVAAVLAEPVMMAPFVPHPNYWLAFGQYQAGEVLDVETILDAVEVQFLPNQYTRSAFRAKDGRISLS